MALARESPFILTDAYCTSVLGDPICLLVTRAQTRYMSSTFSRPVICTDKPRVLTELLRGRCIGVKDLLTVKSEQIKRFGNRVKTGLLTSVVVVGNPLFVGQTLQVTIDDQR